MLVKLKTECGYQFTSKLESMFTDIKTSRDTMQEYKARRQASSNGEDDVELAVQVPAPALPSPQQTSALSCQASAFQMQSVDAPPCLSIGENGIKLLVDVCVTIMALFSQLFAPEGTASPCLRSELPEGSVSEFCLGLSSACPGLCTTGQPAFAECKRQFRGTAGSGLTAACVRAARRC